MSVKLRDLFVCVLAGEKAFRAAGNFTNYLKLGMQGITGYYLEARVENDQFLVTATLLDPHGQVCCRILDNVPQGAECRKELTQDGYRILDKSGAMIFGMEVRGEICLLRGTLYDDQGGILAEGVGDEFLIDHGPAVLGKSGQSIGMWIEK
jgi:hypothetical protein